MDEWTRDIGVAAAVSLFILIVMILMLRFYRLKKSVSVEPSSGSSTAMLQGEMSRIRHGSSSYDLRIEIDYKRRGASSNYHVFKQTKHVFDWACNPSLIYDAVENGWRGFAFLLPNKFPSIATEPQPDSCWEVCQGSSDVMQKIRFSSHVAPVVIATALPLPGPPLGVPAFPSEAYFEITIVSCGSHDPCAAGEGEKVKLTHDQLGRKEDGSEGALMSVGLSGGSFNHTQLPGRYPGSVGFDSNGSVFLDGNEIVNHAEKMRWQRGNEVIGCGFDPAHKRVFFTLSGELCYSVYGTSEEFGAPMYPTLGPSNKHQVVVNFGQSTFSYAQANSHRCPHPCFDGSLRFKSPAALGHEDSKDLFSIGRIDSFWLNRCSTRTTFRSQSPAADFYEEVDADLFDIDLAENGRP